MVTYWMAEFITIQQGLCRGNAQVHLKPLRVQWSLPGDSEEGCLHKMPFKRGLGSDISTMAKYKVPDFVPPQVHQLNNIWPKKSLSRNDLRSYSIPGKLKVALKEQLR